MVGLGEPCITSAQCRTRPGSPSHLCNPINHKCSCERGFTPAVSTNYSLVCTEISTKVSLTLSLSPWGCYYFYSEGGREILLILLDWFGRNLAFLGGFFSLSRAHCTVDPLDSTRMPCSKLQESVGYLSHVLWSPPSLNISSPGSPSSAVPEPQVEPGNNERLSWVVSSLLVVGLGGAALLALLYLKTLQEKRASQARVKSLLRVVAEQSEMRPSLTSLTSFTSSLEDTVVEDYRDYQPSHGEIYHLTAASESTLNKTIPVCHGDTSQTTENKSQIEKKILELQLPPSYDELLK